MRGAKAVVVTLLAVVLAGCTDSPTTQPVDLGSPTPAPSRAPMPADLDVWAVMPDSLGPPEDTSVDLGLGFDTESPACDWEGIVCHRYPFSLTVPAEVGAAVTWNDTAQNLELALVTQGANHGPLARDNPGEEVFSTILRPGAYDLVVAGTFARDLPYHLTAEFRESSLPSDDR